MAGGLLALLDDVALIARKAAASADDVASLAGRTATKSTGVVIDDAAVTPTFVQGADPSRELPIVLKIMRGSLINKIVIILPIALLLSAFAPWLLTPLLMMGGTFLCYEGAHKIIHALGHHEDKTEEPTPDQGPEAEKNMVKGAVTTDFILSAEIMVITLNEIVDQPLATRAAVLFLVGAVITVAVYGVVGLLIKIDDIGLGMIKRGQGAGFGRGLVKAMPVVLKVIGIVGTAAMLWVGGHIILAGFAELLWSAPYDAVYHLVENVGGGFAGWAVDTIAAFIVGALWGLLIYPVVSVVKKIARK